MSTIFGVLVEKTQLQDLKNENDQCLLEIERLTKLVDELQGKNDKLEAFNRNQARLIKNEGFLYKEKYASHNIGYDRKIECVEQNGLKKSIITGGPVYCVAEHKK